MVDKGSIDCLPDAGKSVNEQQVSSLIDRAMSRAGITKKVRAKVLGSFGDFKYADGQVVAVSTTSSEQLIFVSGPREGGGLAKFAFPPNSGNFQAELIRAQDTGRVVSVVYTEDAAGNNILEDLWIYAGSATSSPRY